MGANLKILPAEEEQPEQEPGNKPMRLIAEEITMSIFSVKRNEGKKNYFIEGIFLQAELKNRNGRMYPQKTLAREVAKYDENYIQKGRALGELGHPDGPSINLDRVSHKIMSLKEDGNNFVGKAKLLDTPMGKSLKTSLMRVSNWVFHPEAWVLSARKRTVTLFVMTLFLLLLLIL